MVWKAPEQSLDRGNSFVMVGLLDELMSSEVPADSKADVASSTLELVIGSSNGSVAFSLQIPSSSRLQGCPMLQHCPTCLVLQWDDSHALPMPGH